MSVTTSARLNVDRLRTEVGADLWTRGADPTTTGSKVVTSTATDAVLSAAITAHVFVDFDSNRSDLLSRFDAALSANVTFLALASPTNAQVVAQVQRLTRECSGLLRLGRADLLTSTDGA